MLVVYGYSRREAFVCAADVVLQAIITMSVLGYAHSLASKIYYFSNGPYNVKINQTHIMDALTKQARKSADFNEYSVLLDILGSSKCIKSLDGGKPIWYYT
jgi:hypothetical protein